jgi:hypothetical protein
MAILRPHIPQPGQPLKSTWELHLDSGLSFGEVQRAILDIRDSLHTTPGATPLIYYRREGYGHSLDRGQVTWFYLWRMRTARTVVRRLYTGVLLPFWGTFLSDQQVRRRSLIFDRLVEDMEADIADLELLSVA